MVLVMSVMVSTYAQVTIITDTIMPANVAVPEGYYTLRIYVSSPNESDFVNAVVGSSEYPLSLSVHGGDVWNHPTFGGAHSGQINCNLQMIDPSQRFDSFITLGDTCNNNSSTINVLEDPGDNPWLNPFFQPVDSSSNEISINTLIGGGWFVTGNIASNTMGNDLRVLIAQITTNGTVCGVLNVQIADAAGLNTLHTGLSFGPEACSGNCNLLSDWSVQQPLCFGGLGNITAVPSNGYAPYVMSLNEVQQASLSSDGLSPGEYVASITDAFGCSYEDTIAISSVDPILPIGLSAIPINSSPGGNTEYYITGGTPPYTFIWTGPNDFMSDDTNLPFLTDANQAGEYTLTIIDMNGCTFNQALLITELDELEALSLKLYPNPSHGDLILEGEWSGNFSLRDMHGKELPLEIKKSNDAFFILSLGERSGTFILTDLKKNFSIVIVAY